MVCDTQVPHLLTQDDVYEGYFIPKGTLVMANVWRVCSIGKVHIAELFTLMNRSMCHNEEEYPNPSQFNPSRFLDARGKLNPKVKDPSAAFGFGRRICVRTIFA